MSLSGGIKYAPDLLRECDPARLAPSILHDALELQQLKLGLRWSGDSRLQEFTTARCKYMLHCR